MRFASSLLFAVLLLPGCGPDNSVNLRRGEMARAEQAQLNRIASMPNPENRRQAASRVLVEAAAGGNIRIAQEIIARFPRIVNTPYWPKVKAAADAQAQANGHPEIIALLAQVDAGRAAAAAPPDSATLEALRAASAPAARAAVSDVDRPKYHEAEHPEDFAVIVGIQKYENLPEASFAERDADAVHQHFLALGIPERNIVVLKGEQATRGKLQGYLEEWLPKNAGFDSNVYFYFSGHGAPDPQNGDAYLVPWDGDAKFLQSTAYRLDQVYADLAKIRAKQTVVALDSCFSGAGGRSVLPPGARPLVTQTSAMKAPDGLTILAAASGEEITGTLEGQGHGLFTYYLLKGLNDGRRSSLDLFQFVKPRVQDEAHRQNREQTPTFAGGDSDL